MFSHGKQQHKYRVAQDLALVTAQTMYMYNLLKIITQNRVVLIHESIVEGYQLISICMLVTS